jgi:hypothetical protein
LFFSIFPNNPRDRRGRCRTRGAQPSRRAEPRAVSLGKGGRYRRGRRESHTGGGKGERKCKHVVSVPDWRTGYRDMIGSSATYLRI